LLERFDSEMTYFVLSETKLLTRPLPPPDPV